MPPLYIRIAQMSDAPAIAALVNAAYRGDASRMGWTHEADLLDGLRTSLHEVQSSIGSEYQVLLVGVMHTTLVASICLEHQTDAAHLGMFAVHPTLQAAGIGKQLLTYAERYAAERWAVRKFCMHVISVRHELIAFYRRRGYVRTATMHEFPVKPEMWQPKVPGLQLALLEKSLCMKTSSSAPGGDDIFPAELPLVLRVCDQ